MSAQKMLILAALFASGSGASAYAQVTTVFEDNFTHTVESFRSAYTEILGGNAATSVTLTTDGNRVAMTEVSDATFYSGWAQVDYVRPLAVAQRAATDFRARFQFGWNNGGGPGINPADGIDYTSPIEALLFEIKSGTKLIAGGGYMDGEGDRGANPYGQVGGNTTFYAASGQYNFFASRPEETGALHSSWGTIPVSAYAEAPDRVRSLYEQRLLENVGSTTLDIERSGNTVSVLWTTGTVTNVLSQFTSDALLGEVSELNFQLGAFDYGGFAGTIGTFSVERIALESGAQKRIVPGDANVDRKVDFGDLVILAQNYARTTSVSWSTGDFNFDNAVEFADLVALAQNYGFGTTTVTAASFEADWMRALALVPEPTSLAGLGLSAVLLRRRRV